MRLIEAYYIGERLKGIFEQASGEQDMHFKTIASILLSLSLFAAPAWSQTPTGIAVTGLVVNDGLTFYASTTHALGGGQLGQGLGVRGSLVGGRFRYGAPGQRVKGEFRTAELSLVQQTSGAWGWANFALGPRIYDLKLTPLDPGNRRAGTRVDALAAIDGGLNLPNNWRITWLSSLAVRDKAYMVRGNVGRQIDSVRDTRLGVEAGIQGDPSFQTITTGAFAGTSLYKQLGIEVSGGLSMQPTRSALPYGGVGLVLIF